MNFPQFFSFITIKNVSTKYEKVVALDGINELVGSVEAKVEKTRGAFGLSFDRFLYQQLKQPFRAKLFFGRDTVGP